MDYSSPDVVDVLTLLRRRWWLVAGLPALVALVSLLTVDRPPPTYQARLTFAVDIPRTAIVDGSDEGTAAKIGEALIDDLSRMMSGDVFAAAVRAHLAPEFQLSPGEVASSLSATDRHRVADVTVTRALPPAATPEQGAALADELAAIAEAVVTELETNGNAWFARLGEDQVLVTVIDRPKVAVLPLALRTRLEVPLRTALALVVAIGLAALLHFTDHRLHTDAEVEAAVGAQVLGRIPRRPTVGRRWRTAVRRRWRSGRR